MPHMHGHSYGHWGRGMGGMRRGFWGPWGFGRWGYYRRPCCLFLTLPLLAIPFLALATLALHAWHVV